MLGQEIAILVETEQEAGWQDLVLDAQELTPGVYAYRLQIGSASATETMVVAR